MEPQLKWTIAETILILMNKYNMATHKYVAIVSFLIMSYVGQNAPDHNLAYL